MSAYAVSDRGLVSRRIPQGVLTPMNTLLFGSGEQGAWHDPADLSTLFQDTAGTTPVTAVEQAVALMLDKSGRGNHASQATSTKRFRYSRRINLLVGSTTLATQSITTRAAGYEIVFSGTGSVTLSGTATGVYGAGTNSITCTAGTLTLTVSGSVQDASFHLAIDLYLPYQGINTATDYDADPNKFPAYLACDGIDDALATGSIDFTGTDKMTVWAGLHSSSNAAAQTIAELSANINTNNGSFWFARNYDPSPQSDVGASKGTATSIVVSPAPSAPDSYVLAMSANISGNTINVRRNGIGPGTTSAQNQGGGSYGNYPLYIGGRAGTSLFFNGRLYSLIVRGAQSSQSQIEATELYIKQKMRLP